MSQLGTQRLVANRERFKVVSEALGLSKRLKLVIWRKYVLSSSQHRRKFLLEVKPWS